MDYFQARISIETSEYFRLLKEKYEEEASANMTQVMVISKALEDIASIINWEKVIDDNSIKLRNTKSKKVKDLRIRVQISEELKKSIDSYKLFLPQFTNTRSVTKGVTLKYIFKGALLLKIKPELGKDVQNIDTIFNDFMDEINKFIAPANQTEFNHLLNRIKIQLKKL
ncbi:hypothetical protein [Macrococcus armenti]|uniref:Uncharacterized protein n=1 Tax=Macrococcus armenti TaxID=2875764 RepID=A0ABY3ZX17_9STAP|nr:hypothetical protein [Macrococcus armenti]UOB20910.1 hypothetical protein MRZ06_02180 [Macrococcus armenti]